MKTSKFSITATSAALFAATAFLGAPLAGAETTDLGEQAELATGGVVQAWTISDLKQSTDVVSYPVRGTLWEATATNEAIQGNVQPIVPNLNARTDSGDVYRVLFQVASPQGISPAGLAQGQKATGKVYFDVTGAAPDSVVYNDGNTDLLTWVQPVEEPATSGAAGTGSASVPSAPAAPAAPAETVPGDEPAAATDAAPAATADAPEATTGRQGTPLPEDAALADTPEAPEAPAAATPAPEAAPEAAPEGVPHGSAVESATGSQGTPLPAQQPAGTDDAVQGTPHGPAE